MQAASCLNRSGKQRSERRNPAGERRRGRSTARLIYARIAADCVSAHVALRSTRLGAGELECCAIPKPLRSRLIVDLLNRGVSIAGIAALESLGANGVARKWRRNGLKRLNQRPEMVAPRKPHCHKMWYTARGSPCAPTDKGWGGGSGVR